MGFGGHQAEHSAPSGSAISTQCGAISSTRFRAIAGSGFFPQLGACRSALVAACRDGSVLGFWRSLQLVEGNLEHWRSLAGHGPATQPAAIAAIVNADHLVERPVFAVIRELNAVALMKVGDGAGHGGVGLGLEQAWTRLLGSCYPEGSSRYKTGGWCADPDRA